ncbi:MAG: hypothetical protein KBB77_01455 [Candidatus Moranbacteria bacterium]|jgi:hypothetical protein|nr:hypothetical protein [Candidatus Moranbacteria bacterium]
MFGKKTNKLFWLMTFIAGTLATGSAQAAVKDSDADGLTDQAETDTYHTDPHNADTDGDNFSDTDEVLAHSNPLEAQSIPERPLLQTEDEAPLPWNIVWISSLGGLALIVLYTVVAIVRKKKTPETALTENIPTTPEKIQ